jgi:hypothetical protein
LDVAAAALGVANSESQQYTVRKLQASINAVEARRGKASTGEQADSLIETARMIMNYI